MSQGYVHKWDMSYTCLLERVKVNALILVSVPAVTSNYHSHYKENIKDKLAYNYYQIKEYLRLLNMPWELTVYIWNRIVVSNFIIKP